MRAHNCRSALPEQGRSRQSVRAVEFDEYLRDRTVAGLQNLPEIERADAYVVSFFVYDEDDDQRRPVLTVGTNTEAQVMFATDPPSDFEKPNPWWSPTDEQEARWNYAFWLQNDLARTADSERDPVGSALRGQWFRESGLWFEDDDYSESADAIATAMTQQFVGLRVSTVQQLHGDGLLVDLFGRALPVIVHELEYYDAIAEQNVVANGPELAGGLVQWIASM